MHGDGSDWSDLHGGPTMTPYDRWRLTPPDDRPEVGKREGDECLRVEPPDEDAPKGWKLKPCGGVMIEEDGVTVCDRCGENQ